MTDGNNFHNLMKMSAILNIDVHNYFIEIYNGEHPFIEAFPIFCYVVLSVIMQCMMVYFIGLAVFLVVPIFDE